MSDMFTSADKSKKITVAIAGSTSRTAQCAQAVLEDGRFSIPWVLTAAAKPVGRKQEKKPNEVEQLAHQQQLATYLVEKKIDSTTKEKLDSAIVPDLLLVVDFGYLIPQWLLDLPKIAPLNIHPSTLPKWRGSSPGQFVLLYGEEESAITLMIMSAGLDEGPVLAQLAFPVSANWTQVEYYHHAFNLISDRLTDLLEQFVSGDLVENPQPAQSPTPIARRLSRDDGYVDWETISALISDSATAQIPLGTTAPVIQEAAANQPSVATVIANAVRAFSPWPGVWSFVPTNKGKRRLKILEVSTKGNQLVLEKVQLEGKQPSSWNEIKSAIADYEED